MGICCTKDNLILYSLGAAIKLDQLTEVSLSDIQWSLSQQNLFLIPLFLFLLWKKETSSGRGRIWLFVHRSSQTPTATRRDFNWMPNYPYERLWLSVLHVHAAPGPSTGMTLYRRGLGTLYRDPIRWADRHTWLKTLPSRNFVGRR